MSADKEFTFKEVSEHSSKKDLYLVVHDKVYDCSTFVDEHPYVSASFLPRAVLPRPPQELRLIRLLFHS